MMKKHNTVRVAVADLAPHPLNEKFYGPSSAKADGELATSMREYGQRSPLIICGKRCAHPEGTILAGHRRVRAAREIGLTHLDAIVKDGLSERDEEKEILSDNLASYEHRELTQRQKYEHEKRVRELSGRKQGVRNDLDPSKPAGNTDSILGPSLGSTPNEIKSRRKVFSSSILVPELEAALDDGTVRLTVATSWVREVEAIVAANEATEEQGREELRARVVAKRDEVKARGGIGLRGKRRREAMPLTSTNMSSASDASAGPPAPPATMAIKHAPTEELAEALRQARKAHAKIITLATPMFMARFPKGGGVAELVAWGNEMNDAVPAYAKLVELLADPERVFKEIECILDRQMKKVG